MKSSGLLISLLSVASLASAEFDVPATAHSAADLAQAAAEAKQKNKPLAVLYSDPKTTCPLCSRSSTASLQEFRNKAVVVFADTKSGDWGLLPPIIQTALNSPESGRYIPKLAVFDADLTKTIAVIPYTADAREQDRSYREANKKIHDVLGNAKPGATSGAPGGSFDAFFKK